MAPSIQFFFEGDDFFQSLRQAIEEAKSSIDIALYYFASDRIGAEFGTLLMKKAQEGVAVRLIYDAIGCRETSVDFFNQLEFKGVQIKVYHPILPLGAHLGRRSHRKMMIIDRRIGFLGGINFADEYSRTVSGDRAWRDSGVRFEEEPLVADLQNIFDDSWKNRKAKVKEFIRHRRPRLGTVRTKAYLIPNYGWKRKSLIREEYVWAILHAERSVEITNAYFVPDRGLRRHLKRAARRGVAVSILTAGDSDVPIVRWASHAIYSGLLRAGVRIFEYQGRVMHAKSASVDGEWYTVGTANLDHLSFFRNLEVNLFGHDKGCGQILEEQFQKDLAQSQEILIEHWKHRPWWMKLREKLSFGIRVWL